MVYKLVKFDMRGKVLYTQEEMPFLSVIDDTKYSNRKRFVYTGTNNEYPKTHLWELTDTPKAGAISASEEFLPYFADVTEDINPCYRVKPKKYKNCQLMTEKHGGYYQFYHKRSKQVLRIAINSHIYTPIKLEVTE